MFVGIAFLFFLSVVKPVLGLRDGGAFAYSSFPADPSAKEAETVAPRHAQKLEKALTVDEDQSRKPNEFSFAELNETVAVRKHNSTGACDKELKKLKKVLTKSCVKHLMGYNTDSCGMQAANVLQHASPYPWGPSMVTSHLETKVPVFWAGFSEFDESGIASKRDLADFVKDVNGLLLHGGGLVDQTEWGEAVQEADDLKSCSSWARKKPFWKAASVSMAKAMHQAEKNRIVVAVRKELTGDYSLFKSILYQLEMLYIGVEMREQLGWNPTFEVHEIPVAESSDCKVAPFLKRQLEHYADREVAMTCSLCPHGLRACNSQKQVTTAQMSSTCVAGDCWNGKGSKVSADGDRYEGDFKDGVADGKGKKFYFDGDSYEGDFKNGLQDGKGKFFYASGNRYEGDFKKGLLDGKGTLLYVDGDIYEGGFKNDLEDGEGKMLYYRTGECYQGEHKEGRRDGKGKYVYADGDSYEGDFKDGQKDGHGTYCFADGECDECVYDMGQVVSCEEIPRSGKGNRKGHGKGCGRGHR
ncbi:PIP5K6 [Symbiodinium natans]|uniref:PIP5K6 protein n=1 Tax=Symbiodinium natans TaxID=878477 RepID=A0A812PQZ9_9DINO|nr:PIP5K6 [Symbiodinium natans]